MAGRSRQASGGARGDSTATGTKFTNDQSNNGGSGSSTENGGAEYLLGVLGLNGGSNAADTIPIPTATSPTKCPTFPAAGKCELLDPQDRPERRPAPAVV